jgi:hypothetical protein
MESVNHISPLLFSLLSLIYPNYSMFAFPGCWYILWNEHSLVKYVPLAPLEQLVAIDDTSSQGGIKFGASMFS